MKLKDQVCSLKLAKKLRELGVKQESFFYWINTSKGYYLVEKYQFNKLHDDDYSAFTVAELGEMLPRGYQTYKPWKDWAVRFYKPEGSTPRDMNMSAKTEADARAKMLIYLIENKLT